MQTNNNVTNNANSFIIVIISLMVGSMDRWIDELIDVLLVTVDSIVRRYVQIDVTFMNCDYKPANSIRLSVQTIQN